MDEASSSKATGPSFILKHNARPASESLSVSQNHAEFQADIKKTLREKLRHIYMLEMDKSISKTVAEELRDTFQIGFQFEKDGLKTQVFSLRGDPPNVLVYSRALDIFLF